MNAWYKKAVQVMSLSEALRVFGFPASARPSKEEIKKRYRELARKYHPDLASNPNKMVELNNANDALEKYNFSGNSGKSGVDFGGFTYEDTQKRYNEYQRHSKEYNKYKAYQEEEDAKWQTDPQASSNSTGTNDFRDVNFCKKAIYEYAIENGGAKTRDLTKYQFMAFDGYYFRGSFVSYCTEEALGYAGEVMQKWNSEGANPYKTEAVIAAKVGTNNWYLIRLKGMKASLKLKDPETHPVNDKGIVKELQKIIQGVDANASWYGKAKFSQYLDGGDAMETKMHGGRPFFDTSPLFFPKKDKSKPRKDKKGLTDSDPTKRPSGAGGE